MQDGEYTKHNTALRTVGIIALIALLVWVVLIVLGSRQDSVPPAPIDAALPAGEQLYTNADYGFSLRYDNRFVVDETPDAPWSFNSTAEGTRLFALELPGTFMPHTNFSEARIVVGVSSSTAACLAASNGEFDATDTADVRIPGFKVFTLGDAGAGNFYEVESYRTVKNGVCIALEQVVHSTSIGNYPPEAGVVEFDRAALDEVLDRVIESFKIN